MTADVDRWEDGCEQLVVERILALVRDRTGIDFGLYRPATIERRIRNRMISVGTASLQAYLALLQSTADEARHLVGRLTIKVSRFYRNAATFDHLRSEVLPELARAGRPLRMWSIGCGRGEEAYTLAMLLAEAGAEGAVHSTDVDLEALRDAAEGCYEGEALEELPADLAQRYVEPLAGTGVPRYRVREEIRRRVVFSAHDITREDALPGGRRFDLVAFRNVSIYLKRAAQEQAFERVTNAIAPGGCLCLGESEWPPLALESRLQCEARRLRVFRVTDHVERAAA